MSKELSRRDLLKGSALAAVGLSLAGASSKAEAASAVEAAETQAKPISGRPRVAVIGAGGKGWSGMQEAAQHGDIIAIADVDVNNRSKAMLEHPRAATFVDYREMYEAMKGEIDAVVISTPDHHHAIASIMAMKQGIHCYCEKPLTRTIWEAREMGKIAKAKKVATQMGNQSTANSNLRKVAQMIRQGVIGEVKEVHVWTNRAIWGQGIERSEPLRVPKQLDWDVWLGPAPERPYANGYHTFSWRGWWDFGTGALGDMGCHIFNMAFMALDLKDPLWVQAKTSGHNKDSFPKWSVVDYEFAATKNRPGVMLHWYDGGQKPDPKIAPKVEYGGNGLIAVGSKGIICNTDESNNNTLYFMNDSAQALPEVKFDESPGHMAEFFRAVGGGPEAVSNFPGYAGPLTETVLLGNLAVWADGQKVDWDSKKMKTKGTDEFNHLIRPTYRAGWGF
jgi:predicted dehydrogenase